MCDPLTIWLGVQLACKEQDMHNLFLFYFKVIHVSSCTTCVCKITYGATLTLTMSPQFSFIDVHLHKNILRPIGKFWIKFALEIMFGHENWAFSY